MTPKGALHENLSGQTEIIVGSEKAFSRVFAVVFALVAFWPLIDDNPPRYWALAISLLFLASGIFFPILLKPLNIIWFKFGLLLHKIVNPIIMGLLYFTTVVPTGLIMQILGKHPLRLKFDPEAESYWIERDPPGPDPQSMKRQF